MLKAMSVMSGVKWLTGWVTGSSENVTVAPLIIPSMKSLSAKISDEIQKPTDFSIKVEDQIIHVHKSVLCAASEYFRMMLQSGMKESNEGEMHIQHTRADVVRAMTDYMYFYGKNLQIG